MAGDMCFLPLDSFLSSEEEKMAALASCLVTFSEGRG